MIPVMVFGVSLSLLFTGHHFRCSLKSAVILLDVFQLISLAWAFGKFLFCLTPLVVLLLPPYEDDVVIRLSRPHATPPHLIKITCSRENAMRAIGSCIAFLCIVQFKLYCIFCQNRLQYSFVNLTASIEKIISYSVSDRFRQFTGRSHNVLRAFYSLKFISYDVDKTMKHFTLVI